MSGPLLRRIFLNIKIYFPRTFIVNSAMSLLLTLSLLCTTLDTPKMHLKPETGWHLPNCRIPINVLLRETNAQFPEMAHKKHQTCFSANSNHNMTENSEMTDQFIVNIKVGVDLYKRPMTLKLFAVIKVEQIMNSSTDYEQVMLIIEVVF